MILAESTMALDSQGKELAKHGTVSFPIACYHDDILYDPVPWHWHEELEAGIITEGECEVAIGSERRQLKPGDGFFVNSGVLHGAWSTRPVICKIKSFVFHPRLVGGSLDSIFWQNYLMPLMSDSGHKGEFFFMGEERDNNGADILAAIDLAWEQCMQTSPGFEFEVRNTLSGMVFLLTQNHRNSTSIPSEKALRDSARIKTMLQFIHDHVAEELALTQIAASAMISTSEALRCFKSTIGTTPIQYVKQYRIQKAAELLSSTDLKIAEIGAQCGFQEMSYFAKTFREMKGMTPGQFRERG